MIQRIKDKQIESLFQKYYRKVYWKFIYAINSSTYKLFCQLVNPEIPFSADLDYYRWLIKNYSRKADLQKMAAAINLFTYKPLISIIVPVYNTPESFLREMLDSVLFQVYPHWEICICDDASPANHVQEVLSEYTAKDSRIKVVRSTTNKHISHTSNSAIEIASGEFISLLDHDDLLTPNALYEVVSLLNQHPEADMIYSDEDKILPDRSLKEVFFKQDWCPDSLLSRMYISHLGTYRLSIVKEIGGFRPGYEGSQDYDLVLRFTEKTDKIFHIPKVLYHWRIHSNSTASEMDAKPYATNAAKLALSDAISRRGEPGIVTSIPLLPGHYDIRYDITDRKLVSIIISGVTLDVYLDRCLNSIFTKSLYPNYEVILVDNYTNDLDVLKTVESWLEKEPNRFKFYTLDTALSYSELNNYAVARTSGDYILFLNSALETNTPEWIDVLVEQVQRDSIGAAGALLIGSDDTIRHAGMSVHNKELVRYIHQQIPDTSVGYFGCVKTVNNYSAVSIDCLMCKRNVFDSVGGFSKEVTNELSGVDICLKMLDKDLKNIYLPRIILRYHDSPENLNSNQIVRGNPQERSYFQAKWQSLLDRDPCYGTDFELKDKYYEVKE